MERRFLGYSDGRNWKRWLRDDCVLKSKQFRPEPFWITLMPVRITAPIVNRRYALKQFALLAIRFATLVELQMAFDRRSYCVVFCLRGQLDPSARRGDRFFILGNLRLGCGERV
ncbi:MAG: hypothetical protein ACI9UA_002981 [Pseudoalteromonas tetraodonis]|jgi:hypothetical protein